MATNPETLDGRLQPPKRYRWWRFIEHSLPIIVIYLMVATLVGFLIAPNVIVTVPTGQVGILWKRFRGGTQLDPRLLKDEGMRVLLPWDKLFLYDLRLQTTTDTYNAISKDGVNLTATINIRFRLKHDAIPQLHQTIGPDYVSRLLRPEIGNRAREIIAQYTAEEVYSTKRQEVQAEIRSHTMQMLGQSMVQRTEEESEYGEHYRISLDQMLVLYDTLLLGLELPPAVNAAINRKIEQYYLVQEYAFRVEREKKESERKQIEANGIRAFQTTVSQGISDSYLRWRGIEATLQMAQSPNTKIVIIGSGKDGLPVILGNVDAPVVPQQPQAPAGGGAALPDNSEAAKQKPAAPSPPMLEKTPASNLPTPPERQSPTAVPRTPGAPQAPTTGSAPPADGTPPAGAAPAGAPPAQPGKQSAAPPFRGNISAADVRDFLSRLVWQETQSQAPPPQPGAGPAPPHPPSDAPPPRRAPEGSAPQHAPEPLSGRPPTPPHP
jgi:regulator of protease activity HflC (stomatin/prohibitin superfamily)